MDLIKNNERKNEVPVYNILRTNPNNYNNCNITIIA